jgi:hypothetical protein
MTANAAGTMPLRVSQEAGPAMEAAWASCIRRRCA